MEHAESRAVEHGRQGGQVERERIDERQLLGPGDLDQRHLRVVGALAVELRVDRVSIDRGHGGDEVVES